MSWSRQKVPIRKPPRAQLTPLEAGLFFPDFLENFDTYKPLTDFDEGEQRHV